MVNGGAGASFFFEEMADPLNPRRWFGSIATTPGGGPACPSSCTRSPCAASAAHSRGASRSRCSSSRQAASQKPPRPGRSHPSHPPKRIGPVKK